MFFILFLKLFFTSIFPQKSKKTTNSNLFFLFLSSCFLKIYYPNKLIKTKGKKRFISLLFSFYYKLLFLQRIILRYKSYFFRPTLVSLSFRITPRYKRSYYFFTIFIRISSSHFITKIICI